MWCHHVCELQVKLQPSILKLGITELNMIESLKCFLRINCIKIKQLLLYTPQMKRKITELFLFKMSIL